MLLSISSLLTDPCPENGFGNEASELLLAGELEEYQSRTREWVDTYNPLKKSARRPKVAKDQNAPDPEE